ncbi:MAG: hypothetical protein RL722_2519 [Pseudomonadota bacterium]|jgi:hypothetical protein
MTDAAAPRRVKRRCVLYVSGFDPKGAGHYHALLRDEGGRQAARDGWQLEVGARHRLPGGRVQWAVQGRGLDEAEAGLADEGVEVDYEFLRWDDLIRRHWPQGRLAVWAAILRTQALYLRTGATARMHRLSWPITLATSLGLIWLLVLGLLIPALVAAVVLGLAPWTGGLLATALGLAWGGLLLLAWQRLEARYNMDWVSRCHAYTGLQALGAVPGLDERIADHAQTLIRHLHAAEHDEVLLVGHSLGSTLAVQILAEALRREPGLLAGGHPGRPAPCLSLLTLGQCLPLLGVLPAPLSDRLRADLAVLAAAPGELDWVDFSAPPDACCFALCDPYPVLGLADVPAARRPKLLNPRFAEMFSPERYRAVRRDKFEMHFLYLRAADRPSDYDYFRIVAGRHTLAHRFASRPGQTTYRGLQGWGARRA